MTAEYDRCRKAADHVSARIGAAPQAVVVLGSGLGDFASEPRDPVVVPFADIPGFPVTAVHGHAGKLVVGAVGGTRVAVLAGRVHLYEGHPPSAAVFAIRVAGLLGAKVAVLTNAAGGVNAGFKAGDLMVIEDHLNLQGANPLTGPNDERFGVRFPDMSEVYARRLRGLAEAAAHAEGFALQRGVYAALPGPSYETPAEIRMLSRLGADAVGMSTVPEAIAARHMGMEVLGLSCITNMAAGVLDRVLSHDEVIETAAAVKPRFTGLLRRVLAELGAR